MTTFLTFPSVHNSEPYRIDSAIDLIDAIDQESYNAMSEANSDHLDEPTDKAYEEFRAKVAQDATDALFDSSGCPVVGAQYVDPIGIKWKLIERED